MRMKLLTTTALAMGLMLPAAVVAQQADEPAAATRDQNAAPAVTPPAAGTDQSTAKPATDAEQSGVSQDFADAVTRLEDAQMRFEQAEASSEPGDLDQARTVALDAIATIEQALQDAPEQADEAKVAEVREAIDEARQALQQADSEPRRVSQAIGDVTNALSGLQPATDETASGRRTGPAQTASEQPPRDTNVEQTGKAESTVSQNNAAGSAPAASADNPVAAMGSSLVGMELYDSEDANIGDVEDVVAAADGKASQVLVSVGGFLGIGDKTVAIDVADLELRDDRLVVTAMTEDQIEDLPGYTPPVGTVQE